VPFPGADADAGSLKGWKENTKRQDDILKRESRKFAAEHRFPYVSPQAVASILGQVLGQCERDESGNLPPTVKAMCPDAGATIYVNPFSDADLTAPIPPGHILVDLTQFLSLDLAELAPRLAEIQERLGYEKPPGGRPTGLTSWTKQEFLERLPRARVDFEARHGRKPADTDLATEMGISKATFGRYKKRFLPNS
jgi:hypothetical protein